jgi:hypothetical protein
VHPQEASPPVLQVEAAPIGLTEERLSAALHKTGKAGGPSGWTYEQVRAIDQEGPATMSSVLRLVWWLAASCVSPPSLIAASSRYTSAAGVFARSLSERCGSASLACAYCRPVAPTGWRPFS